MAASLLRCDCLLVLYYISYFIRVNYIFTINLCYLMMFTFESVYFANIFVLMSNTEGEQIHLNIQKSVYAWILLFFLWNEIKQNSIFIFPFIILRNVCLCVTKGNKNWSTLPPRHVQIFTETCTYPNKRTKNFLNICRHQIIIWEIFKEIKRKVFDSDEHGFV